ncbi:MAG: metal-dependent hydrolase [Gemmatimonadetes bacterium]|jgi:L-ascorbate metabolism protein UlaG (beta-lactamase superfamily)|nr:metal-dependent hydrolase [Gemmatimonadota bacterium]MBT6146296.1 metal-dependent hydrolase [Gemmatimonadota bacterium]MBT7863783.1 metal-dependent hydrolase [Gemmatimonadota bacterium]
MASAKITFLGHASFRFESEKGTVIYFDPWLDANPTATMKVSQIRKADIVIASHGHNDHCADAFNICQRTRAKFVGGYEMCMVADAHGLKLGSRAVPLNPGGTTKIKDVSITMTQAIHSLSLSPNLNKGATPEDGYYRPDGSVSGFVLAFDNGITLYDSADTCLFSDMQLIGQMHGPQIAILPVGGKFTMGVREAARAASLIRPDIVIPCHYGETLHQPADIDELKRGVEFLSANTRVEELKVGQTLTYTGSQSRIS